MKFKSVFLICLLTISGCSLGKKSNNSTGEFKTNDMHLIYKSGASSDLSATLSNHKNHCNDWFELAGAGTNMSCYFTLIIHCDGYDCGKQCVYWSSDVSSLISPHKDHGDDHVTIAKAATSMSTYEFGILSCVH